MKDAKGHGSEARGEVRRAFTQKYGATGGSMASRDIAAQHGIPTDHLSSRGIPAGALDHGTLKLIVSNPEAAKAVAAHGMSVPSRADAEGVLRSRYGYSNAEIAQLKGRI